MNILNINASNSIVSGVSQTVAQREAVAMKERPSVSIDAKNDSSVEGITTTDGTTRVRADRSRIANVATGRRDASPLAQATRIAAGVGLVGAGLLLILKKIDGAPMTFKVGVVEMSVVTPGVLLCVLGTGLLLWPMLPFGKAP